MSGGAPTSLSVCVREHVACVRIAGRANFTSSVDFKKLLQQLQGDGCTEIVLDLTECLLMDSTFLGVLAGAGMKCDSARQEGRPCLIELFHPPERILELLDNLGVLQLFTILDHAPQLGAFEQVDEGRASRVELNRTCWEAHKNLMNTSADNERRFRDAAEFFEKNLRKEEGKE
jgi:anti-sigma B factor antagonist